MSDKTDNKREEIKKTIAYLRKKQTEIIDSGIPPQDLQEPRKTEMAIFNHYESIRTNFETQEMILEEIEKTDKVTRRALSVAWISLGASITSFSATIILYVMNIVQ